jgi:preprotein translocase subunit YajC
MTSFVYAQAASPGAMDYLNSLIAPTIMIIGIMYFMMIRPQQKRLKEHRDMVANIRRGDTVVTSGGIIGKVAKVEDNELQIEIADGVRIKVLRGTISEIRGKTEPAANAKSKAASE